jgi:predicted RNA binding protein YcfA (HicA-like mRNA interferase family)
MIKYKEFKNYIESIGFVDESVKSSHIAFKHEYTNIIIILPEMSDDSSVSEVDIVSARRHLVERGLVSDEEFTDFLKASTKLTKKR